MARGNQHLSGAAKAASVARYKAAGHAAWLRRLEAEEAVTCNIPADLMALWARVGKMFKGSPEQRLSAFNQYVWDHQSERVEALQDEADAKLAQLIADRDAADAASSADFDEVPF